MRISDWSSDVCSSDLQVLLAAEVVVDRGDVDVGAAGHLAQGSAAEAVLGEQLLGGAEDAVLGRELGVGHRLPGRRIKRLFDRSPGPARQSVGLGKRVFVRLALGSRRDIKKTTKS